MTWSRSSMTSECQVITKLLSVGSDSAKCHAEEDATIQPRLRRNKCHDGLAVSPEG